MKIQRGADDPENPVCDFSFATEGGGDPVTVSCCLGEAIDDFSQTGQVVWPGATIISHFLLSQRGRHLVEGRNILELGAGVGIPGLLAARLGASNVTLTDHNPICIDLMRKSVALSQQPSSSPPTLSSSLSSPTTAPISVSLLDWSDPVPQHLLGTAQVILGADVIYSLEAVQALFKTVDAIMPPTSLEQGSMGLLLLAYVSRWPPVDAALSSEIAKMSMFAHEIPLASFIPPSELSCFQDAALYAIVRRGQPPTSLASIIPSDTNQGHFCTSISLTASQVQAGFLDEKLGSTTVSLTVQHLGALVLGGDGGGGGGGGIHALVDALRHSFGAGACVHVCGGAASGGTGDGGSGSGGVVGVCDAGACALESLILDRQMLSPACIAALAPCLPNTLRRLSLIGSSIKEKGAKSLCEGALRRLRLLEHLELGRNMVGDRGAQNLSIILAGDGSPPLVSLDLSGNDLSDDGASLIVQELTTSLTNLDLSRNGISGVETCSAIARSPCSLSLATLSLSVNPLREAGAEAMADSMKELNSLQVLSLASCWLGDEGALEVSIGMVDCPCLSSLDLSSNGLSCEGANGLAEALADLDAACLERAAARAAPGEQEIEGGAAQVSGSLTLVLSRNGIGGEGALALARAVCASQAPGRKQVVLRDNPVDEEGGALLQGALASVVTPICADSTERVPGGRGGGAECSKGGLDLRDCGVVDAGGGLVKGWHEKGLDIIL